MVNECKDGCSKLKSVFDTVERFKRTLFGDDGLGGLAAEVGKHATWGWFWLIFVFLAVGLAGSHLYLNSSIAQCAVKKDVESSIEKMEKSVKEANESIHRQEVVVSRIEGAISPLVDVITDAKTRSESEDRAIRVLVRDNKEEMNKKLDRLERKVDRLSQ
jgi:hypothetical protein